MALDSWLIKFKRTLSQTFDSIHFTPPIKSTHVIKKSRIRVLAFEVAGNMCKLADMWRFLADENINHLHNHSISLQGVRKIVSNKDTFLINLACAEMVDNIRVLGKSVSQLSKRCDDASLKCFETAFNSFANTGHDPYGWVVSSKDMNANVKKMERYVAATSTLYKKMDYFLNVIKNINIKKGAKVDLDIQGKLHWQDQEIKYLKERSLWNKSYDGVTILLATSIFTILARIKLVFGIVNHKENNEISQGLFETYSKMLKPSSNTLGYDALSLHYANLIIVMEKMIKSPQLVGLNARDDLYSMLPNTLRLSLRGRLKGIGFIASDRVLAGEWREALCNILGWLSPLAHNTIKWQNERSFEHQNLTPKTNVLLLQTLFFANRMKTEAAITELLVGLNYIWRFKRELNRIKQAK